MRDDMSDELRTFTDAAGAELYPQGEPLRDPAPENEFEEDGELEVETDAADEGGDQGDWSDAEHTAFSTAFWASLSDEDVTAAEGSPAVRDSLWASFLAEQGFVSGDEGDDEAATGVDVVRYALENANLLMDADGDLTTPAAWISSCVDASPRAWQAACREANWPTDTPQPSHNDLRQMGRGVQGAVLAESWADFMAKEKARGARW